jgi:hypothetical protein
VAGELDGELESDGCGLLGLGLADDGSGLTGAVVPAVVAPSELAVEGVMLGALELLGCGEAVADGDADGLGGASVGEVAVALLAGSSGCVPAC